jgi:hypothetical protein
MQTGQETVTEPITASEIGMHRLHPLQPPPGYDSVRELAYRQTSAVGCGKANKRRRYHSDYIYI